jgi:hypothetical protein
VTVLDTSQRLSPEQQAQWVAKLQAAEFREPDMPSDLLGAGLWIAYAVLALVWFRSVAQRRSLRWLATVCERVVAPMVARQMVRGLESVKWRRPPEPIFREPAAACGAGRPDYGGSSTSCRMRNERNEARPAHAVNRTGTTPCCKARSRLPSRRRSRSLFTSSGSSRIASRGPRRSEPRKVWVCFR